MDSATTIETLAEDEEYATRPRDQRQQRRRVRLDEGPEESMTTTKTSGEEDNHKDYSNDNRGVGRG